jgi:hypothetical protein
MAAKPYEIENQSGDQDETSHSKFKELPEPATDEKEGPKKKLIGQSTNVSTDLYRYSGSTSFQGVGKATLSFDFEMTTTETVKIYSVGEGKDAKIIEERTATTEAKVLDNTIDLTTSGPTLLHDLQARNGSSRGSEIGGRTRNGNVAFDVSIQLEVRHAFAIIDYLTPKSKYENLLFQVGIEGRAGGHMPTASMTYVGGIDNRNSSDFESEVVRKDNTFK